MFILIWFLFFSLVTIPIGSYEPEYHLLYLIKKIESTLKKAKENKTLPCTEILSPQQLIHQIAQDIIGMAESEPCGIRGCVLYINLEEKSICRRIGEVKLGDQSTVATFEMYLTLKRASSSWLDAVESKLFGKESVVLSELYKLSKKKLFRSLSSPWPRFNFSDSGLRIHFWIRIWFRFWFGFDLNKFAQRFTSH